MVELLILILQVVTAAGLLLVAVLVAALLSGFADPEPVPEQSGLRRWQGAPSGARADSHRF